MSYKKYSLEFLLIFVAVISAFALNNWNENKKNKNTENKILLEIYNGLKKDLIDIDMNITGHEMGINAVKFFRDFISKTPIAQDSVLYHYVSLTRDFILLQNTSGYETLKSKGLELIQNDSLRTSIISLYEYDYSIIRKLEEEYNEMQFHESYYKEINQILSKCFIFDSKNNIVGIDNNVNIEEDQKRVFLTYLWKIEFNRKFLISYYTDTKNKITKIIEFINEFIKK